MPRQKNPDGNQQLFALRKRIAGVPAEPGVYRWLDKNGKVLYIGKAKNVRNRLQSYVRKQTASMGPWKLSMLKQIADFEVTVTNNELEALVLETNLIKEEKPKYNVLMKDDKSYLYVQISQEPYPVIEIVRREVAENTVGFGPYTSAHDIRSTMDMLHLVFPYKACQKSLEALNRAVEKGEDAGLFSEQSPPCLEQQIGECCGLCVGAMAREEYGASVEHVRRFLKGDRTAVIDQIRTAMQKSAEAKRFERAAQLRDVLRSIERMEERQIVSDASDEDLDVIGMAVMNCRAQAVLFRQRSGRIVADLSFTLAGETQNVPEALAQFLPQYYSESPDIPSTIVIAEAMEECPLIEQWLRERSGHRVELRVAERGKKSQLLALAQKNAQEKIKARETKWEAAAKNIENALVQLKEALALPTIPKRIEGYDISHLSGTETVGSMAVMKNGKAANDQYRSFTIRSMREGEIDDYKALGEVLRRRLKYLAQNLKEEEAQWKRDGITFGKTRKSEVEFLQKMFKQPMEPKEFLVARAGQDMIGCASLHEHTKGVVELTRLWTKAKGNREELISLLARKLLRRVKKGKIYATMDAADEHWFGTLGFRYIQEIPKPLQKKGKGRTVMMYSVQEHRDDVSLSATPNLLVIDGGKGQLSVAVKILKELRMEIPVIGLAKREEEIFLPGQSHPIPLPKESQAQFLLMRLRNEAHRFANAHREKRSVKGATRSVLDAVPGIGETTKRELLKKFGSVINIRSAPDAELSTVLSEKQLAALRAVLPASPCADSV